MIIAFVPPPSGSKREKEPSPCSAEAKPRPRESERTDEGLVNLAAAYPKARAEDELSSEDSGED